VFIREIAPRRAVSLVARLIYNENYVTMPMRHTIERSTNDSHESLTVSYGWRSERRWNQLRLEAAGPLDLPASGAEAEFIAGHYFAYSAQRDASCLEYKVDHVPWQCWPVTRSSFDCDVAAIYGPEFVKVFEQQPSSAMLLDGSAIAVRRGVRL